MRVLSRRSACPVTGFWLRLLPASRGPDWSSPSLVLQPLRGNQKTDPVNAVASLAFKAVGTLSEQLATSLLVVLTLLLVVCETSIVIVKLDRSTRCALFALCLSLVCIRVETRIWRTRCYLGTGPGLVLCCFFDTCTHLNPLSGEELYWYNYIWPWFSQKSSHVLQITNSNF